MSFLCLTLTLVSFLVCFHLVLCPPIPVFACLTYCSLRILNLIYSTYMTFFLTHIYYFFLLTVRILSMIVCFVIDEAVVLPLPVMPNIILYILS